MTTTGEIANLQATAFSRQSSAINSWSTSKISVSGVRRRNSNKIKEAKDRKTKNKTELFPRDQKSREISICVPAHLAKNSLARPQILPLAGQEKNFRASSTSLSSIAKADQLRNIDIPPQREVKITRKFAIKQFVYKEMPRFTDGRKRKIDKFVRQRTTWTCNVCTYENAPSKFKCKVRFFSYQD